MYFNNIEESLKKKKKNIEESIMSMQKIQRS